MSFTQTFCTETSVDTGNGRQNRHYFPILCIFTHALIYLTNNSQVFYLKLSWMFHLLTKKWLKKSRLRVYRHQTDNRLRVVRTSEWKSVTSFVRGAEVRNSSCSYYLSDSSSLFTENTVNMDLSSSPASDSENTYRFFKHFCFCAPWIKIKSVGLNFLPAVLPSEKKKQKNKKKQKTILRYIF